MEEGANIDPNVSQEIPPNSTQIQTPLPSKLNKRLILIVVFLVFLCAGLLSWGVYKTSFQNEAVTAPQVTKKIEAISPTEVLDPTWSVIPAKVRESTLYFQNDQMVYKRSPLSEEPVEFLAADTIAFSPDNNKVAYIKEYIGDPSNFFILDLQTSETREFSSQIPTMRGIDWSEDGKYILINAGTGPEGGTTVFNVESGSKVGSFSHLNDVTWADKEIIYYSASEPVMALRPWGGGDGSSIIRRDIRTNEVQTIFKADDLTDFHINSLKDTCLNYTKTYVQNTEEWTTIEYENIKKERRCYDLATKQSQLVSINDVSPELDPLANKLAEVFAVEAKSIKIIRNETITDWVVAVIFRGDSAYDRDIYLLDPSDIENSKVILGKGVADVWIK